MVIISIILGVSLLLLGAVLTFFPSRNKENGYGYRTFRSTSDEKLWEEGNRLSGKVLLYGSPLGLMICLGINIFFNSMLNVMLQFFIWFILLMSMFIMTEKRLIEVERNYK